MPEILKKHGFVSSGGIVCMAFDMKNFVPQENTLSLKIQKIGIDTKPSLTDFWDAIAIAFCLPLKEQKKMGEFYIATESDVCSVTLPCIKRILLEMD